MLGPAHDAYHVECHSSALVGFCQGKYALVHVCFESWFLVLLDESGQCLEFFGESRGSGSVCLSCQLFMDDFLGSGWAVSRVEVDQVVFLIHLEDVLVYAICVLQGSPELHGAE